MNFRLRKPPCLAGAKAKKKTNTDKISKIQEALTNQEKRIGLLEKDLDITCLENWAYTDELDEHKALMASIQDQLERANSTMASLEQKLDSLKNQHQHRETGSQSQCSYWNSSGQEEYHSLDSNNETNRRLPCSIQVLEVVAGNGGLATVTIEDTYKILKHNKKSHTRLLLKPALLPPRPTTTDLLPLSNRLHQLQLHPITLCPSSNQLTSPGLTERVM
ncbi:hypothetical protein DSO57_1026228 [Entomophthora muscae]|uniref:Uncharacterized protein n=1 Tax=Entomophthora muscae TaxID=34485 RepID=A0ACC2SRD5_9FUNG|nr:hypothetical protein DSO57_1026228 [Entomophthora muscae]